MGWFTRLFSIEEEPEERADETTATTTTTSEQEADNALLRALLDGRDGISRQMAEEIPAITACIDLIAATISMLPIGLYTRGEDKKVEEVTGDQRLFLLNNETGDTLTPAQMWRAVIADYYLGKGAFVYINKNNNKVESLHYVDETNVSYIKNTDPIFKDFNYIVDGKTYGPWQFIKFLRDTKDGIKSQPIYEKNPLLSGVAYKILIYERNLIARGGNKRGFLESDKTLGTKEFERLKEAFRKLYSSSDENVIVLNNGVKFKESSNTSVEMQLDEMQKAADHQIYKLFGIPVKMIEGGATKEDRDLFLQTIASIIWDLETSLDRDLLLEAEKPEKFFAFDTRELTRGNIEDRYKAYEIGLKNHFLQVDEVRQMEDLEPLNFKWMTLGLDTVLLDPETNTIYTPNTDAMTGLQETGRIREKKEETT